MRDRNDNGANALLGTMTAVSEELRVIKSCLELLQEGQQEAATVKVAARTGLEAWRCGQLLGQLGLAKKPGKGPSCYTLDGEGLVALAEGMEQKAIEAEVELKPVLSKLEPLLERVEKDKAVVTQYQRLLVEESRLHKYLRDENIQSWTVGSLSMGVNHLRSEAARIQQQKADIAEFEATIAEGPAVEKKWRELSPRAKKTAETLAALNRVSSWEAIDYVLQQLLDAPFGRPIILGDFRRSGLE